MKQYNIIITEHELQSLISALNAETCRLTSEVDEIKRKQLELGEKHPANRMNAFMINGKTQTCEKYSDLIDKLSRVEIEH